MANSQINRNSIRKNVYCSKLILFENFFCLEWSILLTGGFIWLLTHMITLLSQRVNELISFLYYLIHLFTVRRLHNVSASIKGSGLYAIMSSKICKEYREYIILHQTSYTSIEHCVICTLLPAYSLCSLKDFYLDVARFVNQPLFIWF